MSWLYYKCTLNIISFLINNQVLNFACDTFSAVNYSQIRKYIQDILFIIDFNQVFFLYEFCPAQSCLFSQKFALNSKKQWFDCILIFTSWHTSVCPFNIKLFDEFSTIISVKFGFCTCFVIYHNCYLYKNSLKIPSF